MCLSLWDPHRSLSKRRGEGRVRSRGGVEGLALDAWLRRDCPSALSGDLPHAPLPCYTPPARHIPVLHDSLWGAQKLKVRPNPKPKPDPIPDP